MTPASPLLACIHAHVRGIGRVTDERTPNPHPFPDAKVAGAFHEHCARGQNQQGPADPLSRGCLESQSITRPVCFGENVGHAAEHSSALERVAREAGCRANDIMNLRTSMQQAAQQVLARIHVRKLGYSDNIYEHCIRSLEPSSSSVL
jgi:hypothetical protein